ncbi:carboxymuconolactone decarboxylase family protein [uncultured Tolumonas sp.]|uniref:carboxymuconolactone decarboxylase family protein n=1 Tax=uncultured Tolumonas sp. TaxID=263765 RepID=UPI002A0A5977|nr:carboxymuconolactone decarboxylase family protein [uncultured Tolumonas sp.]
MSDSSISSSTPTTALSALYSVAPALERYTQDAIINGIWMRPDLSARDRSIVTIAALVARKQTHAMHHYFTKALDHDVKPAEISEIITHMAFYAGWPNAFAAIPVLHTIFEERGIGLDQLPESLPELLPLDLLAEQQRADYAQENLGAVSQIFLDQTTELMFKDLWLRPALSMRDRLIVVISSLIASGRGVQFLPFYLTKAMSQGLTKIQVSEMLAHLAFYVGWPTVFSASFIVKEFYDTQGAEK